MQELLAEALRPVNLPFTVLLGAVIIYWLLVAIGALGIDLGADGDADVHADSDADGHGSFFGLLDFVNLGEVPLTLVASLFALCAWMLSMLANFYWVGSSVGRGFIALVVIVIGSAVITRYFTLPFRPLMRAMNSQGEKHVPVVGRTCLITTSEANPTFGQAQIETQGAPILINVRTMNGAVLPRGSTVLVVKEEPDKELYYVMEVSSDVLA